MVVYTKQLSRVSHIFAGSERRFVYRGVRGPKWENAFCECMFPA